VRRRVDFLQILDRHVGVDRRGVQREVLEFRGASQVTFLRCEGLCLRLDREDQAEYNCPVSTGSDGRREFFEIYSKSYSRCFGPDPRCRKKIIRAHSIPNARELEALQDDGHVITLQVRFGEEGPQVKFAPEGRNDATTFRGLCGVHDNAIFGAFDSEEINLSDERHRFLLAYRAVIREFYMKARKAFVFTKATKGVTRSDGAKYEDAKRVFAWAIEDVFSFFPIKAEYDHLYLRSAFSGLRSEVVTLGCAPPVFAASSLFGPTSDVVVPKDPVASRRCLTVNVLPLDSATSVVFSWLPAHQEFADRKLRSLRSLADCEARRHWISKEVIKNCENFVMKPSHFESFRPERRSEILSFFTENIVAPVRDSDSPDLDVFIRG